MPTYAYRGTSCTHEFETVQKYSDDPLTSCPECGGPIRRVFQPVGVVFKGSGWYVNDSRKQATKTPDKKSGDSKTGEPSDSPPRENAGPATASDKNTAPEKKEAPVKAKAS